MKASVIISAFNSADYIGDTLRSVLVQDFEDFEILVVDDGSTDKTESVVRQFENARIPVRYIYQENSGGPSRPRNVGIEHSLGEFLFIFDSDDLMLDGKLAAQVSALEACESAVAAFTQFQSIDENDEILREHFLRDYQTLWNLLPRGIETEVHPIASDAMFQGLIRTNFVGTSSVALRASMIRDRFKFNESMSNSDDRLMWITLAREFPWVYLGAAYHQYRERRNSITRRNIAKRASSKIRGLKIVRDMCTTSDEVKLIDGQISEVLYSLTRSLRGSKQFAAAFRSGFEAVRYGFSWRSIKVWLSVPWYFIRNLSGRS